MSHHSNNKSFSFLITTDNHLGFKDDDHIRRKDSYRAFREALSIARSKDVDFVLLGGDLFHVNRPSLAVEHKCVKIIRQHMNVVVDRGTSFKRIKGTFCHFDKVNVANFEDNNLKVPYPILTIHGNHDDPTGPTAQSVCQKLATAGLLNYFGAIDTETDDIHVKSIILQKGDHKIALYGIGFIPDHKLYIAFEKKLVTFDKPPKDTFNVLVCHQNRVPINKVKTIPDSFFPDFFHLIIRGHEHTSLPPEPIPGSKVNGIVYQPGSTVATSISVMEAGPKSVGLVTVKKNDDPNSKEQLYSADYDIIHLNSCRCMILKDIVQKDLFKYIRTAHQSTRITSAMFKTYSLNYVQKVIKDILRENNKSKSHETIVSSSSSTHTKLDSSCVVSSQFNLPLLRIRLEYASRNERFDEYEISNSFYPNQVANRNIILFKKRKVVDMGNGQTQTLTFADDDKDDQGDAEDDFDDYEHINLGEEKRDTIDIMIENYFRERPPEERLMALSLREYTNAVKASNEDGNVISKVLDKKRTEVMTRYMKMILDEEVARSKYQEESQVHDWFVNAFASDSNQLGGDKPADQDVVCCE